MIYVQNQDSPSRVLFSFDDVVRPNMQHITWAVAYATYSGCKNLTEYIMQKSSDESWYAAEKNFIISIDYGHTEPYALEYLSEQRNSAVYIANSYLLEQRSLRPSSAFHPKVYCFDYENTARILAGSANLTKSALHRNVEAVQTQSLSHADFNVHDFTMQLRSNAVLMTPQLLEGYRTLRSEQRPPTASIPEEPPQQPENLTRNIDTSWLWGAIEQGLTPQTYEYFWIEAGSMSSGGSRNQLELARGSNYFFGFEYDDFINQGPALEIGFVNLSFDGQTHLERIYRWHSNNMMERLNLPTLVQGGIDYQYKCVIFRRRTNNMFELLVLDWESEESIDWRAASDRRGLMYRISQQARSNSRVCGFL